MKYQLSEFSEAEWDVLLYIASHIAGEDNLPTRENVLHAGLENSVVEGFIDRQILREVDGKLQPVPEMLRFPSQSKAQMRQGKFTSP